jgi:hypothetical protein
MGTDLLLRRDFALCACGCARTPPLAKRTYTGKGYRKGEPIKFARGHHGHAKKPSYAAQRAALAGDRSGYCLCGCGLPTAISTRTSSKRQEFMGFPLRFRQGHWKRWDAKQRAMRKPQQRQLCTSCYQDHPSIAFVANASVCIVCVARAARQNKMGQADRDRERQRIAKRRTNASKAAARRAPPTSRWWGEEGRCPEARPSAARSRGGSSAWSSPAGPS